MHENRSTRALKPPKPTNGRPQNRAEHARRMEDRRTVFQLPSLPDLRLTAVFVREQRSCPQMPRQLIRPSKLSPHCVRSLIMPFQSNEPYESEGLTPQQIRNDFAQLVEESCDPDRILRSLAGHLSASDLAEFMDDYAMGRV